MSSDEFRGSAADPTVLLMLTWFTVLLEQSGKALDHCLDMRNLPIQNALCLKRGYHGNSLRLRNLEISRGCGFRIKIRCKAVLDSPVG